MYQFYLTESILKLRFESEGLIYQDALTFTEMDKIPYGTLLITYYISFFILAEGAFVFMAIKEYLQDLLGLSEVDLIEGKKVESNRLSE
ncbi:hypothetical protein [Reichenbachiella sp.]|uniref:hypothetical protein n=1 Tax=Reichenbachiella sp. TaxID=2184521 RepID=UPI003BB0F738